MAHGVGDVLGDGNTTLKIVNQQQPNQSSNIINNQHNQQRKPVGVMGSRRIFAAAFKLKVLDSYRNDIDCRGNQRATARKYGIHRRQIQKWLQCEENLRSSCAENGVIINNSTNSTTPGNIGSGIVSNKCTESTITSCITSTVSSPTPAATQAPPALNLSLARLHGDELVSRQGPPPPPPPSASHHHPVHHPPSATSPTSNQSYQHPINPVHTLLIGYTEFTNQNSQHNVQHHNHNQSYQSHHHQQQRQHVEETTERKYYTLSHSGYDQTQNYPVNDTRIYEQSQSLTYQSSIAGCNGIVNDRQLVGMSLHETGHVPSCHDSSGNSSPAIKNERASPDSPATPGSCIEAPSSPGNTTTTTTSTTSTTTITNTSNSAVSFSPYQPHQHHDLTNDTAAVHFEPHMHINVHAHACSTLDSKKSPPDEQVSDNSHQLSNNNTTVKQEIKEEPELCIPKEEIYEEHEEINGCEERDCLNYQCSERSITSIPPSPRGVSSSSGQSISSCSDSETDPLDYSSIVATNINGDMSRRRSFSLRFKLDVLDAFHGDVTVAGNQRATARKFGINRRQVQKWLGQECELRGEITFRGGDMRQRLGPLQEIISTESPVDLTTSNLDSDQSSELSPIYICDSSTQRLGNYYTPIGSDITDISQLRTCNILCCTDNSSLTNSPINLRTCHSELHSNYYCYSERDSLAILHDRRDLSPLKRSHCAINCDYDLPPSPKRMLIDDEPQDSPLCLVLPKQLKLQSPIEREPVTSTVPTPPAPPPPPPPPPKKDPILFKPYLDNPISKPTNDKQTLNSNRIINSNSDNNNCHSICNLNEDNERHHDYAVELSLRLPISWRTPADHHYHQLHRIPGGFPDYSDGIRSAFDRYPATTRYT